MKVLQVGHQSLFTVNKYKVINVLFRRVTSERPSDDSDHLLSLPWDRVVIKKLQKIFVF